MRTRIKVMDLTSGQWDWLEKNLRDSYDIPDTAIRVCVQFDLPVEIDVRDAEVDGRHVEMSVRMFAVLVSQLQSLQIQAQAVLTPDALPDYQDITGNVADSARADERTCDHGSPVVAEMPSAFRGAEPIRDYADGCQSYGPYQNITGNAADPARQEPPTVVEMPKVRNDCAFCHYERSPKDDNHAPECPYWVIGPGKYRDQG